MIEVGNTLIVLLIILFLGLVVPEFSRKFKLPFVTVLIIIGAILGPNGLDYSEINQTINFFGFLGMSFLMLMAGIETDISKFKKDKLKVFILAFFNGFVPFLTGFFIMQIFGYDLIASLLVGIVFISSSVAIIVPTLQGLGLLKKRIGQLILSSVLITDIISLFLLGFIFQKTRPITHLPLIVYYILLVLSIFLLFFILPRLSKYSLKKLSKDIHTERRLRFVIIVMMSVLIFFSILGVHPILAAFLAGIILSEILHRGKNQIIYEKIHTLGFGLFIPTFFFVVGMEMDLSLFGEFNLSNIIMISLICGLILSKIISGFISGKLVGLKKRESLIFGSISIVQLTTTLAVTFTASSLGILDNLIITSIILISLITTIVGPVFVSLINKK